ncbi:MAG: hypothetical protein KJ726_04055, partial [Verrucomicrobia bacterium]|nr:hypothetical protein [Verrucomicrobiota bacterium]MBU1909200.1 hypothetical protein [Verrucomicrobiota bacterium]
NKADQTITFPNPGPQETTNRVGLSATASSGQGVSFAVVSGPGSISGDTNLTFTGAGVVSLVASQGGDANWNPAPEVTNTFPVSGVYVLTVQSAHGPTEPPPGDYVYAQGTVVTNSVQTPDASETTQHVCVGWTMTGHDPGSGEACQFVMTMTNNAVLTWQWSTRYWLDTEAGSHGAVNVDDGWQGADVTTQILAIAEPYYHFTGWTGDASGEANPLDLLMDGSKTVMAHFAENLAALGTPEWWLAQYYPGTNDFDSAELSDTDGDDYPAWQEWIAGTDPTNSCCNMRFCPDKKDRLTFISRTGRLYSIQYKSSMSDSTWAVMTNHIEGTGGMIVVTSTVPNAVFRLKVDLP